MTHGAAPTRLAATAMLLRDAGGAVEALLVRRHRAMAFLGGAWVFPGGKLDPVDRSPESLRLVPAPARERCQAWAASPARPCSVEEALALYVAACRETFEEAGVLLAGTRDGLRCSPDLLERLQRERDDVARRPAAFLEMLLRERLELEAGMIPWAHWITPSAERIRFDARFFAVHVPSEQRVFLDAGEATDHLWVRPGAALEAHRRGEMTMAAPTSATLAEAAESIAAHGGAAHVIAAETGRVISPILPKLRREDGGVLAVMPWDPEYDALPGEGLAAGMEASPTLGRLFPSRAPVPAVEVRMMQPASEA